MSNRFIDLDLDEITYAGESEEERKLNRMLLETTIELNGYQDAFDNMRTVNELKERIENIQRLIHEEYVSREDILRYEGEIKALEWVLNGSLMSEEQLYRLPKMSKKDVERIIHDLHQKTWDQLSIFDMEGVTDGEKENS